MKLKAFIAAFQGFDQNLNVELTKVMFPSEIDGQPVEVRLDFPIIGVVHNGDDLHLVVDAAPDIIAFGKKIRRLDGAAVTKKDVGL